jgi:hypothetical protein
MLSAASRMMATAGRGNAAGWLGTRLTIRSAFIHPGSRSALDPASPHIYALRLL